MEPPQAESPQVRHSLHQLEVQGGSLGLHGQRNVCAQERGGKFPELPPLGKQTLHLWKAAATVNTRERESHIYFLALDTLGAGRGLWAAFTCLFYTEQ